MAASSLIPRRAGSHTPVNVVTEGFRFVAASSLIPPREGSQPPVNVVQEDLGLWLLVL